jgi:hopanoid biosynthesis associated RND transporter like protein HpnN
MMINTIKPFYQNLLVRWTSAVSQWAWAVSLLSLLSCGVSIVYLANNVEIDTSTADMLSAKLSFRQNTDVMDRAFPQMSDTILVVVDGTTPDIADRTALKISQIMRADPKVFGDVYDPAGEDFFRRNGLLYLDVDELYELSDRLAEAQPFLGALWQDLSLNGLFTLLGKAIDHSAEDAGRQPIEIAKLLNMIADVAEAQADGKFSELSWRKLMQGDDDSANANRRFLLIQPSLNYGSLSPASDAIDAIRKMVHNMALLPENGVRIRLTGSAALSEEELESVEQGMGLAGILSLCLVLILLMIGLKRVSLVVSTLLTLLVGLIWTATFAIVALGSLNLISVAFAVLFIGLSVDFGIHYSLRYTEAVDDGADHQAGLISAVRGAGGALTLSAVAAAIAFYSFQPTDYRGLAELGLIAGTGMFIALFANLTLLPAFLSCLHKAVDKGDTQKRIKTPLLGNIIQKHAKTVCMVFVAAGVASLFIAKDVDFDFDPLNLKDKNTESMSTLTDLMEDSRTSPYSIEILAADLKHAQKIAENLRELKLVDSAETLADYVPPEQDEKLDAIDSTALFLAPALAGDGGVATISDQQRRLALEFLIGKLKNLNIKGTKADREASQRLGNALSKLNPAGIDAVREFEKRLLRALPAQLMALKRSLLAEKVSLEDLPLSIRSRQIAQDGRARIEVYPKNDLRNRAELVQFVEAVRAVAPNAIGSPVVILEAGQAVLRSFYQAGALSVVLIMIMLAIVLGNIRDVLLVFAPLILAGVYSLALSVLMGLSFNFANVIVLPLLFGLGVAGGIHLVSRDADVGGQGGVLATATPRAVTFSALTTIGSFGTIALSGHPGTSSMGVLLTLTVSMTLLCTLVFLPALMKVVKKASN